MSSGGNHPWSHLSCLHWRERLVVGAVRELRRLLEADEDDGRPAGWDEYVKGLAGVSGTCFAGISVYVCC
jgi:hypothetical protein